MARFRSNPSSYTQFFTEKVVLFIQPDQTANRDIINPATTSGNCQEEHAVDALFKWIL